MFLFIDFCTCSWLIPWLLPFLLGLLLGWLIWGRLKNRIEELESENAKLRAQITGLENDLSECNAKNAGIDSEIALLKGRIREFESSQSSGSLGIMGDVETSDHDVQIDVDGDGDVDIEGDIVAGGIDIDGDGVADIEGEVEGELVDVDVDLDGDGEADVSGEIVEGGLDIDGDGEADIEGDLVEGGLDVDGDGEADIEAEIVSAGVDIDGDGEADIDADQVEGGLDIDGDGDADIGSEIVEGGIDIDGDGDADLTTSDSGMGVSDAAAAGTTALGAMSGAARSGTGTGGKNIYGALKEDNLQIVEGIGPKMNEILNDHGVNTWAELAGKSTSELRGILDSVNAVRYRIIDPSSWHEQARLAVEGNWDGLISLQKNLDSGRRAGATGETDSKVEKMLIKLGVLKKWKKDDLTAIEGIGPKISQLLRDNGITTWRELANTSVSAIQDILDAAGKRYKLADPGSWPKQAEMAADGRWDDLEEYQDFLQGGK